MATAKPKKIISQETFNECVRENMEEFDMLETDAIADAVTQFESQGVDLSAIVKGLDIVHPVVEALQAIQYASGDVSVHLLALQEQFRSVEDGVAAKELAGRNQGPSILLDQLSTTTRDARTNIQLLLTLQSMVTGVKDNQNAVGEPGIALIYDTFLSSNDVETQDAALGSFKAICARNERTKKLLTTHGVIARLVELFQERDGTKSTKPVAELIRVLTIHDDSDSIFSQTHDIVKAFVEQGLIELIVPSIRRSSPPEATWLAVLKQVAITEDNCKKLVAAGILDLVHLHKDDRALLTYSLGLLRNLAAVDEYKSVVTSTSMEWILATMAQNPTEVQIQTTACATIAAVCLRSPANCTSVAQLGAHRWIGSAMVQFPSNISLLRQASLAIRNMVVRNPELRQVVLEDPVVEKQLRNAMPLRGCGDEAYAALRDLGADVPLASIGQSQANFNPVMESSKQLMSSIQENAHAPFED
ncbi:Armadillo repeat-containing protein 6 [Aphanomyces cochlioides]|nr:Armadillo repeat-containing protein 6 [Aphanomyces cochlioides]